MCARLLPSEAHDDRAVRLINGAPILPALRQRWWLLLAALVIGIVLSHAYWLPTIRHMLLVADPLRPVDTIVPLAGGLSRASYAAMLYRQGYAEWFVVTDRLNAAVPVYPITEWGITEEAIANGVPQHRLRSIMVPIAPVGSTYEEALAVRDLAELHSWQTLIVVTSAAHTRRSQTVFRDVFAGSGIRVIIRPADCDCETPSQWWLDTEERSLVWQEYLKLVAYRMGYR